MLCIAGEAVDDNRPRLACGDSPSDSIRSLHLSDDQASLDRHDTTSHGSHEYTSRQYSCEPGKPEYGALPSGEPVAREGWIEDRRSKRDEPR